MVLMSADDLESLEATIELLADREGMSQVAEGDAALAAGDVITSRADLEATMAGHRGRSRGTASAG